MMGVKELWPLLTPVMTKKTFDEISGQTVAVDLSMWIVDSQCVKQMIGTVTRPHLRNLFFRTSALLQAGVLPVFVVDGKAPEVKWQTMAERQKQRKGNSTTGTAGKLSARRANRSQFNAVIKECCEMLGYLGVPVITADGEAEAMCAALNYHGLVDAVITDDGDAFLYGAQTVYRNFTTTKTSSVDSYNIEDVENKLNLSKNHLISLALLIGCDYCPKGVPGVGKTQAIKFCSEVDGNSILTKILHWSTHGLSGNESPAERLVAVKICRMEANNFVQTAEEFGNESCKVPSDVGTWKKPLISKAQDFHSLKMEWPINYSLEKMLPLLTLWSFNSVMKLRVAASSLSIQPEEIVKKRVRQGVDCLEVQWAITDPYVVDEEDMKEAQLVTVEPLSMMEKCFPQAVSQFLASKTTGKTRKAKQSAKQAHTDQLISQTARVSIQSTNKTESQPAADVKCKPYSSLLGASVVFQLPDSDPESSSDVEIIASDLSPTNSLNFTPDHYADLSNQSHLEESSSLSVADISTSIDGRLDRRAVEGDGSASSSVICTNGDFKIDKKLKRNSIDELLADISAQLKTPTKDIALSESIGCADSIITGYITPEGRQLQPSNDEQLVMTDSFGSSRIVTTEHPENRSLLSDSDLSLFNVENFSVSSQAHDGLSRVTGSTPLVNSGLHRTSHLYATYGEFDLVPQLSLLSFTD